MTGNSVFGFVHTGYAVVTTRKLDAWRQFGRDALGLHMDERGPDLVSFRMDELERRLIVRSGDDEDYTSLGLEVTSSAALDEILRRLKARGVVVAEHAGPEADLRGVDRFWSFDGPKRQTIELFETARSTAEPLQLGMSGFLTGEAGLFHVAITSKDPDRMIEFWQEIFDARLSDKIEETMSGVDMLITFLRLNERHHSIAVARTKGLKLDPIPTKIQHMAFQVGEMDDVTRAFERCKAMGYEIAMSMGQHTNDREVSFYVVSPSGFEIELGWNPLVVNEDEWDPQIVHQGTSIWGHKPLNLTLAHKFGQFRTGLASMFRSEYRPY